MTTEPASNYYARTGHCQQCRCGHGNAEPTESCAVTITVDLIRDDYEGPIPHSFPCLKRAGHDEPHLAHVTWLDGED
jgi:hypothetical protein